MNCPESSTLNHKTGLLPPPRAGCLSETSSLQLQAPPSAPQRICHGVFAAKEALEYLGQRRNEIIQAINDSESPVVVLAGFNEDIFKRSTSLLQEVHIYPAEELELTQATLDKVGQSSAPFPSVIFLPSGRAVRPTVYDTEGNRIPLDRVIASAACDCRFNDAKRRGLDVSSISERELSRENRKQGAESNLELQSRGAIPQYPPVPQRGAPTGEPGQAHFEVTANIHGPNLALVQQLQLAGKLSFHSIPQQRAKVQFNQMKSQSLKGGKNDVSPNPSPSYSQRFLKIMVDTDDPLCAGVDIQPRTMDSSSESQPVQENLNRSNRAPLSMLNALKLLMTVKSSQAATNSEVSRSKELSLAAELVDFKDRVFLEERPGSRAWTYHVDDEAARERGIELSASYLPMVELEYSPDNEQTSSSQLTVEVSSFWSLVPPQSGSNQFLDTARLALPGFSNLCQDIWLDLAAAKGDDRHSGTLNVPKGPN